MDAKKLYKSNNNSVVSGVCGGIGEYFNIDPVIVRLIWVVMAFLSAGAAVLVYIIAAFIIPDPPGGGEKKRSKGCLFLLCIVILGLIIAPIGAAILNFLLGGMFLAWNLVPGFLTMPHGFGASSLNTFLATFVGIGVILAIVLIIALVALVKSRGKKDE